MALDAYKKYRITGLQAVRSAGQQGAELSTRAAELTSNPELKAVAQELAATHAKHSEVLAGFIKEAGADPDVFHDMIMDGVVKGATLMLEAAGDENIKEIALLGGETSGLNYFIPAYAKLAQTEEKLGHSENAASLKTQSEAYEAFSQRYGEVAELIDEKQAA